MKNTLIILSICFAAIIPKTGIAQFNEAQTGAWYMYFYNTTFKESSWGLQGDIQYRNWDLGGDLEQLLIRSGVTYVPKDVKIKFTLGYGNITTGAFGDVNTTTSESRFYQEALFPVKFGNRFYTNLRFRFEQRFVDNQEFRTRYRYNLFLTIPLNKKELEEKSIYLALYNELFINAQREIGNGRTVEIFDRNRFYTALGYIFRKGLKIQVGYMTQSTDNWSKSQIQLSLHQKL